METIQKIRSAFNLINLRKEVESLMKYNDLHMEDIVEIGGPSYIYDGTTEEFFDMLEYYYSGNPRVNALMFDIRFEDGSRIYTEVDTDYNMVLVQYAMPPKHREKVYFRNTLPPEMERKIAGSINGKDPEYIKEVLRILRISAECLEKTASLIAKLPDDDQ